MLEDATLPNLGDVVDGTYRIEAKVGEGGMGVVYAATHVELGTRWAIKWLQPKAARDPNAVRRFLNDARLAARIRHPNIVQPVHVSTRTGAPFIVMEFLEGETLEQRLTREGLSPSEVQKIFMPVLSAVTAAHAQNVIHRDLKPDNIFLTQSDNGVVPKVLDFGIAKDTSAQVGTLAAPTRDDAFLGTLQYMSPEQIERPAEVTGQTDIYALGVVLYRMLAGKLPYHGSNLLDLALSIQAGRPVHLAQHRPDLDSGLTEVVMKAIARSRELRYPDVPSFAHALGPMLATYASGLQQPSAAGLAGERGTARGETQHAERRRAGAPPSTLSPVSRVLALDALPTRRRSLIVGTGAAVVIFVAVLVWRAPPSRTPGPAAPTAGAQAQPRPSPQAGAIPPPVPHDETQHQPIAQPTAGEWPVIDAPAGSGGPAGAVAAGADGSHGPRKPHKPKLPVAGKTATDVVKPGVHEPKPHDDEAILRQVLDLGRDLNEVLPGAPSHCVGPSCPTAPAGTKSGKALP